ncbi:MAG: GTPase HflX [Candidatus Babeliaceae bacterium]|nr:GTPase HflX [Candidatus Babeliaceae bacterium]
MTKPASIIPIEQPKTLLIGIHSPFNPISDIESYYQEFKNLALSNGVSTDHFITIKLRSIDAANFLTQGKLDDVLELIKKEHIEEVIFSDALSPQQERNLSRIFQCQVFDRTDLILEIFEKGAQSAEGKTQVGLAMLQHQKSRLSGRGLYMSQQGGRIGTRGPGETQKEKETQHIEHLMLKMRRDLEKLQKVRETQRKQRISSELPLICLIGYTNAGKSTILNALTKSSVLAEDKLFATLDTTTRELFIEKRKIGLISDTVGFIQQLPHKLIEAFKSTLSELKYAHILLQVIDAADKNWQEHIQVVHDVLEELGASDKPMLYVFNKSDKLPNPEMSDFIFRNYQPHVLVSATAEHGLDPLKNFLVEWKNNISKSSVTE